MCTERQIPLPLVSLERDDLLGRRQVHCSMESFDFGNCALFNQHLTASSVSLRRLRDLVVVCTAFWLTFPP